MSILIMLLLLSILIIAHEFGHFFVARWCGVRVERFGFGLPIGPPVWAKKVGDVEVCVHALLFGGYVAFPDDNADSDIPEDSTERFENQSKRNRAAIALAGVTVNAIMAWLIMVFVALTWGLDHSDAIIKSTIRQVGETTAVTQVPPAIAKVLDVEGLAVSVNGEPIDALIFPTVLSQKTAIYPGKPVPQVTFWSKTQTGYQTLPLQPSLAAQFGIGGGDAILAMNGEKLPRFGDPLFEVVQKFKGSANTPLLLTLRRPDGAIENLEVLPNNEGRIGIALGYDIQKLQFESFGDASAASIEYLNYIVVKNFQAFGMLFSGQVEATQLSGPIKIVDMGAKSIDKKGIEYGLLLSALISAVLAVMNLLPIPPLDGFHLVLIAWEALRGNPMDKILQERVMIFGYVSVLLLMGFVLFNDIINVWIHPM